MVAGPWPDPAKRGPHLALVETAPDKRSGGPRRDVMIPATIVCPDGNLFACVIRDMSPTGAKIAVSRRHRLPRDFSVAIPGRDIAYPVHRAWQRGDFAGIVLAVPAPGR